MPRKGKQGVHTGLLQLQARRMREAKPSNYSGCKRAKEELQKRKSQKSQTKEPIGRVFSSRLATHTVSFAEAVKGKQRKQPQQNQTPKATTGGTEKTEKQSKELEREQPV
jgi:hypothetical protein